MSGALLAACAAAGAGLAAAVIDRYATPSYLAWYLRMRRARHRLYPPPPRPAADGLRVVASLSTIPSRVDGIRTTLNSLLLQSRPPDRVYLNVPRHCRREGSGYRLPPDIVADPRVRVHFGPVDLGPIMKLVPTLGRETHPATLIVTVDDDAVYPRRLLATLLRYHADRPRAALGFRGWRVPPGGRFLERRVRYANQVRRPWAVHVLSGVGGVLYRRDHFGPDFPERRDLPPGAFFVDDICISGYLEARGVARYLVPFPMREPFARYLRTSRSNPLWRVNRDGRNDQAALDRFFRRYCEPSCRVRRRT